jgi:hypothetical protein
MHELYFDSWTEFIDKADKGVSELNPSERISRSNDTSFTGTGSWEDAMRLARQGWAEGAKRMQANLDLVVSNIPAKKMVREFEMSRVGPGVFDFNRIRMGHPEPWIVMREYEVDDFEGSKIVKIAFNGTASAGVSTREMFNKGALIGALVDQLERAGKRVEVLLMLSSKGRKTEIRVKVMLKRAQDPLDVDRLAFGLAHASTLRRFGFSVYEQMPNAKNEGWSSMGGYGMCTDWDEEGCINVRSSDLKYANDEQTRMDWLKKQMADQGIDWNTD